MSSSFPDLSGLRSVLGAWAGSTVYVMPLTDRNGRVLGNNGDALMHRVFLRILTELSMTQASAERADLVVVPPNGALIERYVYPQLLTERLARFRSRPLVLFPSSALFPTIDPARMFRDRSAPTTWILREQPSYEHLSGQWGQTLDDAGVRLLLDHDVVASGHAYVHEALGSGPLGASSTLVAARNDVEASSNVADAPTSTGLLRAQLIRAKSRIPNSASRSFLERTLRARASRTAGARLLAAAGLDRNDETLAGRRFVSVDLSAPHLASFAYYSAQVRAANTVVTNRLHVALPAAVLGKRVYLVNSGYHKLSGVYHRSLTDADNVTLVGAGARDTD